MAESRTEKIERLVAHLCGVPLTAETVFLRPTRRDGLIDKEVCDVLLALRADAVMFSLKSQENPKGRTGTKVISWCGKHAGKAVGQLSGAVRAIKAQPFWCDHPRRGRVHFAADLLRPRHAVVILETLESEVPLPPELPDQSQTVPVTYLSLNDTLNLIGQVRSFPDLVAYLDARVVLPPSVRRTIGREELLYTCYLLDEEQFPSVRSLAEIAAIVGPRLGEFMKRQAKKALLDRFAPLVELVCDALATRGPDFAVGLDADTLAAFDADRQRGHYLRLQEELCDLRLTMRRELGFALFDVRQTLERSRDRGAYRAFQVSEKPDLVYLLVSTRGIDRPSVLKATRGMLFAAKTFYGCRRAMAIVDLDGASFEVCLIESDTVHATDRTFGQELFGRLRNITVTVRNLPL
jgi:hypothetical protein